MPTQFSMEHHLVFDLHSHSNCSDGILSPQALVSRAKEKGVTVLALTDHDTIAGIEPARQAAADEGVTLVAGIEFSSRWGSREVHVLGLGLNAESPPLLEEIGRASCRERQSVSVDEGIIETVA